MTLKNWVLETLDQLASRVGLRVMRAVNCASFDSSLAQLQAKGLEAKTVFDVGVATGTPELYRVFPKACFHLIDPDPTNAARLQRLAGELRGTAHPVALGATDGTTAFDVWDVASGSTMLKAVGPAPRASTITVPLRRLDTLIANPLGPILCKIDVQGAELMVLQGAVGLFDKIDVFLVEVSTLATLQDAPELASIVDFMSTHGYVVYDIAGLLRRPLDGALAQLDLVFVRADSPLRSDRRWST